MNVGPNKKQPTAKTVFDPLYDHTPTTTNKEVNNKEGAICRSPQISPVKEDSMCCFTLCSICNLTLFVGAAVHSSSDTAAKTKSRTKEPVIDPLYTTASSHKSSHTSPKKKPTKSFTHKGLSLLLNHSFISFHFIHFLFK
jgi:hypothetical protein